MSYGFRCKCCKQYFKEFDEHGKCPHCHAVQVDVKEVIRSRAGNLIRINLDISFCDDIEGVD
jgi:Zn finger protein HypA/HybF involved in hydrogenase expression